MKIGVYIDNKTLKGLSFGNLSEGNPGIGGTEYCVLFLCQELSKRYPDDEVFLFCKEKIELAHIKNIFFEYDLLDFINNVNEFKVDICLISYNCFQEKKEFLIKEIDNKDIKVVLWGHNYYFEDDCNLIADSKNIKANVFVGKQQYDRYIDHRIINKSTYIFNMYPVQKEKRNILGNEKNVTYIGSLVYSKGFHVLAKQWKKIIKRVPNAELYVIGSGKLYDRNQKMGKFNIAEESYENSFMPFLLDSNGEILSSVHFLGVLGPEKSEIIKKTSVGVVNPTARTETFGISAMDFEAFGVPVVTKAKGGFLDTVINKKTGLLYSKEKNLYKKAIKLLLNDKKNMLYGLEGAKYCEKFSPDSIIEKWHRLFEDILVNKEIKYTKPNNFYFKDFKIIRIFNKKIKNIFRIKKGFSLIGAETKIWNILNKKK